MVGKRTIPNHSLTRHTYCLRFRGEVPKEGRTKDAEGGCAWTCYTRAIPHALEAHVHSSGDAFRMFDSGAPHEGVPHRRRREGRRVRRCDRPSRRSRTLRRLSPRRPSPQGTTPPIAAPRGAAASTAPTTKATTTTTNATNATLAAAGLRGRARLGPQQRTRHHREVLHLHVPGAGVCVRTLLPHVPLHRVQGQSPCLPGVPCRPREDCEDIPLSASGRAAKRGSGYDGTSGVGGLFTHRGAEWRGVREGVREGREFPEPR